MAGIGATTDGITPAAEALDRLMNEPPEPFDWERRLTCRTPSPPEPGEIQHAAAVAKRPERSADVVRYFPASFWQRERHRGLPPT
jgi:hypothetical protein